MAASIPLDWPSCFDLYILGDVLFVDYVHDEQPRAWDMLGPSKAHSYSILRLLHCESCLTNPNASRNPDRFAQHTRAFNSPLYVL